MEDAMIPNIFHFIFGLLPEPHFGFLEYLAIRSAHEINRPARIFLHHQYECTGPWWEKTKELVTLNRVEAPAEVFARKINHFAHRGDVLRLRLLQEHGGIYMDIDTLCVRPFTPLLGNRCVLGRQGNRGLCNAVILSEPQGEFVRTWLESYRTFRSLGSDCYYDEHSVVIPGQLARDPHLQSHVTLLGDRAFFYPLWDEMQKLFVSSDPAGFKDSYCIHYWESHTCREWLSKISAENAADGNSNFARFVRRVLNGEGEELDWAGGQTQEPPASAVRGWQGWAGPAWRKARALARPGATLLWLGQQARDAVWLPRLIGNLGFWPALTYLPQRLRIKAAMAKEPFVRLRSKHAAHPLRCRPGPMDLRIFDEVFVVRSHQCLDDLQNIEFIVECGANVGYASAYLLTRFPSARLLALEPDPDLLPTLEANLAPYGDRARALGQAIWPHPAEIVLAETAAFHNGQGWKRRTRVPLPGEVADVTATDIPTLLAQSGFDRISLLKLNIGGAESALFAAHVQSWIGKVDQIAIEVHEPEGREAFMKTISAAGYLDSQHGRIVYCARPAAVAHGAKGLVRNNL
jgi:FkbM family methyltransferase